ncbi:tail tubular protein A [Escherichia phage vB_EcoM_APEC]|nr:tail tubular protein A [Escherichia phage vB_EcoM_APEC]
MPFFNGADMNNTKVSIANYALALIGSEPIQDFESSVKNAKLIRSMYDIKRRALLRDHPWSFARKRIKIAPSAEKPDFGYSNKFALPRDFIRLLDPNQFDFTIEGAYVLVNAEELQLSYIYDCDNEAIWDDSFALCMSYALGADLCKPITGSDSSRDTLLIMLRDELRAAKSINGQQLPSGKFQNNYVSPYIAARY